MEETPFKRSDQQKDIPQTGVKEQEREGYDESRGPESEYQEQHHEERRERDPDEVMTEIEREIKKLEGRLRQIQTQKNNHEEGSEEHKNLED